MSPPGRIGIFGGTFDPPHVGHRIVAADVVSELGLDRLLVVPAAQPPHRDAVLPAETRLAMTRAAFAGDRHIDVSDVEFRRKGPSYMVDTLETIQAEHPGSRLFLVLGTDQYEAFGSWRNPDRIVELAELAVVRRRGHRPRAAAPYPFREIDVTRVDVSSTEIRRRLAEGLSVRYLVPEVILADLVAAAGKQLTSERPMGTETIC